MRERLDEQRRPDLVVADERPRVRPNIEAARTIGAGHPVPTVHVLGVFGEAVGRTADHAARSRQG